MAKQAKKEEKAADIPEIEVQSEEVEIQNEEIEVQNAEIEPVVLENPIPEKKGIMDMTPEDLEPPIAPVKEKEKEKEKVVIVTPKAAAKKEINTADPNVSCKVIKKHSCTIGKVPYDLVPDRDVVLPNSVATILQTAGVLIKR